MSSKRPKSLSPDDLNRPSVTLVAVVERAEDIQPERWTAALQREGPNFAELIILDRRDASTGLPSRWPSIHRPGPFTGPAFEAAAAHARARAIALLGRDAHRAPGHLRAAVKVLDLHAGIDLVISDYSLRNPQPGIQQVIQLS